LRDVTPELEADDLAAVVDAVGGGPADVFGSSGGAVAGLALVARHPDKVRTLIAHEPPVCDLLPDAAHIRAAVDGVEDAYRTHGPGAAFGKFVSIVMHQGPVTEDGVPPAAWPPPGAEQPESQGEPPQRSAKEQADDELFLLRMLKPFTRYEPDVDVLRWARPRVVVAVGDSSHGEIACRSAEALAEQLGSPLVRFPGDHGGFMADPAGFAAAIRQVAAASR
jgi:pimeloyl-ACP methyl ester carboxylesterase